MIKTAPFFLQNSCLFQKNGYLCALKSNKTKQKMKKLILILVAAVGVSATSCGSFGGKVSTAQDSLAYAFGVNIGTSLWNNVDSTMNPDLICKGIQEVFAKKDGMKPEEAEKFIQYYMGEVKPRVEAEKNIKLSAEFLAKMEKEAGVQKSTSGLLYKVENEGVGEKPVLGDTVSVEFTLYDATGKKLQSSKDFGKPMEFVNTEGSMIKGFLEGIALVGQGGKATLYIPAELAYGEGGPAPQMALQFDIEMIKVAKPAAAPAK